MATVTRQLPAETQVTKSPTCIPNNVCARPRWPDDTPGEFRPASQTSET